MFKIIIVTVTDIIAYYYHNSKQIFIYFAGSIFYRIDILQDKKYYRVKNVSEHIRASHAAVCDNLHLRVCKKREHHT